MWGFFLIVAHTGVGWPWASIIDFALYLFLVDFGTFESKRKSCCAFTLLQQVGQVTFTSAWLFGDLGSVTYEDPVVWAKAVPYPPSSRQRLQTPTVSDPLKSTTDYQETKYANSETCFRKAWEPLHSKEMKILQNKNHHKSLWSSTSLLHTSQLVSFWSTQPTGSFSSRYLSSLSFQAAGFHLLSALRHWLWTQCLEGGAAELVGCGVVGIVVIHQLNSWPPTTW